MTRVRQITLRDDKILVSIRDARDADQLGDVPDCTWDHMQKTFSLPVSSFHAGQAISKLEPRGWISDQAVHDLVQPAPVPAHVAMIRKQFPDLWDSQVNGIDFLYNARGRAILADDPGMGKTYQALALTRLLNLRRILIVAPTNVTYQWQAEIEKRLGWPASINNIAAFTNDPAIVSWEHMVQFCDTLQDYRFPLVIFDEAHRMKSLQAQRTRAARKIGRLARHVLFLTGTPLINKPEELWPLLNLIDPNAWPNFASYKHLYCDYSREASTWRISTPADLSQNLRRARATKQAELAARLTKVLIRRTKGQARLAGIIPERLPDEKLMVDLPAPSEREYRAAQSDLKLYLRGLGHDPSGAERARALVLVGVLRRIVGRGKISSVIETVEDLLDSDPDRKVVVYAIHGDVVDGLQRGLQRYGLRTIRGDTPPAKRREYQQEFQQDDGPRIMLITEAGEEGIDLYRANYLVMAEQPWTPKAIDQAAGRIDRGGQTLPTTVIRVMARGSVDQRIERLIERKRQLIHNIVGDDLPPSLITEFLSEMQED